MKRRKFIAKSGMVTLGMATVSSLVSCNSKNENKEMLVPEVIPAKKPLKLSLAQWSLNKELNGGTLDNLDFAGKARSFDLDGVEYVNQFFMEEAENVQYLSEMITRAKDADVEQLLIMVDNEGDLAAVKKDVRLKAIDDHKKWVDAAKYLGCHSIRVNLFGELYDIDAWIDYASHGLGGLTDYGAKEGINVIVENHGWLSSNAAGLVKVMQNVNNKFCGTLPDFGNFCVRRPNGQKWGPECEEEYDRYQGVDELMPYAKAVSAKSHDFDESGNEINTDYEKMMGIVNSHGFEGFIGVEYEGEKLSSNDGIIATRDLLRKYI